MTRPSRVRSTGPSGRVRVVRQSTSTHSDSGTQRADGYEYEVSVHTHTGQQYQLNRTAICVSILYVPVSCYILSHSVTTLSAPV